MIDLKFQFSLFSEPILESVTQTLNPTHFPVLISSSTGVGKTTLAKLIAGRITPTAGKILVDGVNIADNSEENLLICLVDGAQRATERMGNLSVVNDIFANDFGYVYDPFGGVQFRSCLWSKRSHGGPDNVWDHALGRELA